MLSRSIMDMQEHRSVENSCFLYHEDEIQKDQWKIKSVEEITEEEEDAFSSISSIGSITSNESSLSDMDDDVSSSNSSSSSLCNLSELMSQLPIKRGLSKFYPGKSESFTSLSRVTSVEDLVKKQTPYRNNIKSSKSYGGGLNTYKLYTLPKPSISKKSKTSSSYISLTRRGSFVKPPLIPSEKSFGCLI